MEAQIIPHPRAGGKENRTGLTMDKQDIQDIKNAFEKVTKEMKTNQEPFLEFTL